LGLATLHLQRTWVCPWKIDSARDEQSWLTLHAAWPGRERYLAPFRKIWYIYSVLVYRGWFSLSNCEVTSVNFPNFGSEHEWDFATRSFSTWCEVGHYARWYISHWVYKFKYESVGFNLALWQVYTLEARGGDEAIYACVHDRASWSEGGDQTMGKSQTNTTRASW
jgi:hypothetical protein